MWLIEGESHDIGGLKDVLKEFGRLVASRCIENARVETFDELPLTLDELSCDGVAIDKVKVEINNEKSWRIEQCLNLYRYSYVKYSYHATS